MIDERTIRNEIIEVDGESYHVFYAMCKLRMRMRVYKIEGRQQVMRCLIDLDDHSKDLMSCTLRGNQRVSIMGYADNVLYSFITNKAAPT